MAKSDHSQQGPSLKAAIFEVLDNQLRANDPPETHETLERLKAQATDEAEARRLIGCVIAAEIFAVMKTKEPFNRERFTSRLSMLPEMPWAEDEH